MDPHGGMPSTRPKLPKNVIIDKLQENATTDTLNPKPKPIVTANLRLLQYFEVLQSGVT